MTPKKELKMKNKMMLQSLMGLMLLGCGQAASPQPEVETAKVAEDTAQATPVAPKAVVYDGIERMEFNRLAVRLNLPVYWKADSNDNKAVDADEIVSLRFYPDTIQWIANGKFTEAFAAAWKEIELAAKKSAADDSRLGLMNQELDQGRATLVYNDLRGLTEAEKKMFGHLQNAAVLIDKLYSRQLGIDVLAQKIPADDRASASVFRRNWSPNCVSPKTESNPACNAIEGSPKTIVSAYPESLQKDADFCKKLEAHADSKKLLAPFAVVREKEGALTAVPLPEAYPELMKQLAVELTAAEAAIEDKEEGPLKTYLKAAATSLGTNDWEPADEAWAAMNAQNSKWYLRVGPDETYWEPCTQKAGFHMTLALINPDSLAWQEKLKPVQQEMEQTLADLIGTPYKARTVTFHLPDFIDIVTNSGDDRNPLGATVGQSLPNWGAVANEGRGRTVTMSNLYTDPDSMVSKRTQASSLVDAELMKVIPDDLTGMMLTIILHEATHNLGPSHDYSYKGKTNDQGLGGPLSTVMEELKAETGALFFIDFLLKKKIISEELARQAYAGVLTWCFGHISRGMYTASKRPKPYSQLAAILVGYMLEEGAVEFKPELLAANGNDKGAFVMNLEKMPATCVKIMKVVGKLKATNDKDVAQGLVAKYVDGDVVPQALITERMLRASKASFVYAYDI
jgi:hypothetical protein